MKILDNHEATLVSGGVYLSPSTLNPENWFIDLQGDSSFVWSLNRHTAYHFEQHGVYYVDGASKTLLSEENAQQYGLSYLQIIGMMPLGLYVVGFN